MTKILIGCLTIIFAASASATDYYIDPAGSDSNNGTSTSTPWRTCSKAGSTAVAGDLVQFRGGTYPTYNCRLRNSGTSGNEIVFENFPGETPVFEASHIPIDPPNKWNLFAIVSMDGDFTILRGFEIKDAPSYGLKTFGDDNVFANNEVHHTFLTGIHIGTTSRITIDNNHIYDVYDYDSGPPPGTGGGGDGDCIGVGYHPGPTSEHVITNNIAHDCSDDGIDTWTSRGNTITGNISYHNGYIPFTNTPAGNGGGFKLGGVSQRDGTVGGANTARKNVAANNRVRGFDNNGGTNNILENNTAYNNSRNYDNFPTSSTMRNNLCWAGDCNVTIGSFNSWNLGTGDALFISTDSNNAAFLRLSSNSPAIDVGTDIALPYAGNRPDLGAYESDLLAAPNPPADFLVTSQ